jgi:gamma-glutamylaminecyclotransferase
LQEQSSRVWPGSRYEVDPPLKGEARPQDPLPDLSRDCIFFDPSLAATRRSISYLKSCKLTDTAAAFDTLFVYGTLKEGFCNFAMNRSMRVPGDYITVQPHGLYVVGPHRYPWLVQGDARGQPVRGQLFRVDATQLAQMDRFEQVDEPGWYTRRVIDVRRVDKDNADVASVPAYVYVGSAEALQTQTVHAGPLTEFSIALQTRLGTTVG